LIRGLRSGRKKPLRIAVVLYGQQRFHRPEMGILRTIRILKRYCTDVQILGHLWTDEHDLVTTKGFSQHSRELLHQVEVSNPTLIHHLPPSGQDVNLVRQATSQHRAIQSAMTSIADQPDLVLITRTDLWIPIVRFLTKAIPDAGEVWTSNFHHSKVDDNIALLTWIGFQKLYEVDFVNALESAQVLHGEHLRAQLLSQTNLHRSDRLLPYVILRRDKAPYVYFTLAIVRMALRRSLPSSMYDFATSPKTELVRLLAKVIPRK
jgi:hypothetical protein